MFNNANSSWQDALLQTLDNMPIVYLISWYQQLSLTVITKTANSTREEFLFLSLAYKGGPLPYHLGFIPRYGV